MTAENSSLHFVVIEADLQYPGTVKVNVIRETRFAEIAR